MRVPGAWVALLVLLAWQCPQLAGGQVYSVSPALKKDRDALMELKRSVSPNGFGTSRLQTWNALGNPCMPTAWPHIRCWKGRVYSIDLANKNVQASLPAKFSQLSAAVNITLDGNRLFGSIPAEWANRRAFQKLKTLSLKSNRLSGTLPNSWNKAGTWPSLQTLDLSQNRLVGGLPNSWLGDKRPFRVLRHLDLSDNRLGYQADGVTLYITSEGGWCQAGVAADGSDGWCPTIATMKASLSKMPNLQSLDISNNSLNGALPTKWGYAFPRLAYLLIRSNSLYATTDTQNIATALPVSWVRSTIPVAFSALQMLVLYPGNPYICGLPNANTGGRTFVDVAGGASYAIADTSYEVYDTTDPWPCPAPAAYAAPVNPGTPFEIEPTQNQLIARWSPPANAATAALVFGYEVSLTLTNPDRGTLSGWSAKLYTTYQVAPGSLPSGLSFSGGVYTLSTGVKADGSTAPYGTYRLDVSVLYIDGGESDPLSASASTLTIPAFTNRGASIDATVGTPLSFTWQHADTLTDTSFTYSVSKWTYGQWGYTTVGSGGSLDSTGPDYAVLQSITPSAGDTYNVTITASRALRPSITATNWWAVVGGSAGAWTATYSTVGPKLAPPNPTAASVNAGLTTLSVTLGVLPDAPRQTTVAYSVTQFKVSPAASASILSSSAVTTRRPASALALSASIQKLGGVDLSPGDYFIISAQATPAESFQPSNLASYQYTYLENPAATAAALDASEAQLTVTVAVGTSVPVGGLVYNTITQVKPNAGSATLTSTSPLTTTSSPQTLSIGPLAVASISGQGLAPGDYWEVETQVKAARSGTAGYIDSLTKTYKFYYSQPPPIGSITIDNTVGGDTVTASLDVTDVPEGATIHHKMTLTRSGSPSTLLDSTTTMGGTTPNPLEVTASVGGDVVSGDVIEVETWVTGTGIVPSLHDIQSLTVDVLDYPVVESGTLSGTTLQVEVSTTAPAGATLSYVITQRQLLSLTDQEIARGTATVSTTTVNLQAEYDTLLGLPLALGDSFLVELQVSATGKVSSVASRYRLTVVDVLSVLSIGSVVRVSP